MATNWLLWGGAAAAAALLIAKASATRGPYVERQGTGTVATPDGPRRDVEWKILNKGGFYSWQLVAFDPTGMIQSDVDFSSGDAAYQNLVETHDLRA